METAIFWVLLGLVILFALLFVVSFFKQRGNLKWVTPLLVVMLVIFVFQGNISELTIKVPGAEMSLKAFRQAADSAFAGVPISLPLGEAADYLDVARGFAERIKADSALQEYLAKDVTILIKFGNIQYATGKIDDALATYDRASVLAEQKGDRTTQAAALGNMSQVFQDKGEKDKAIEYQEKVLDISRPIDVDFPVNGFKLQQAAKAGLDRVAEALVAVPIIKVMIEGYTDSDGSEEYNQTLSEKRAGSVRDYLVNTHNLNPNRFTVVGYGEANPVAPNDTPENKAMNRRVELRVIE